MSLSYQHRCIPAVSTLVICGVLQASPGPFSIEGHDLTFIVKLLGGQSESRACGGQRERPGQAGTQYSISLMPETD